MIAFAKRFLNHPSIYFWARHVAMLGLPFRQWVRLYGLDDPAQRVGDIGCGPADILRYVARERLPSRYVGVDVSEVYLDRAKLRAKRCGVDAEFVQIDLTLLNDDPATRRALTEVLHNNRVSRVLLLGIIHHIDDESSLRLFDLLAGVPTIQTIVTQDVVMIDDARINNAYARRDRGQFVRDVPSYLRLFKNAKWHVSRTDWTSPGLWPVKYVHFTLERRTQPDGEILSASRNTADPSLDPA